MTPPPGSKGLILLLGLLLSSGGTMAWADDGEGGNSGSGGADHQGSNTGNHSGGEGPKASNSNDAGESEEHNQNGDGGTPGLGSAISNLHELSESPEKEQEEARQAVATGRAAPLTKLLEKLKTDYPGQILDVALLRAPNKLKFAVKYIDVSGVVKTVTLDAVTLSNE